MRGYYSCKTKSRKFYKYIFTFLLDVAITNAFILMKHYSSSSTFANIKAFSIQLAKELIGDYSSCCRRGRGGGINCSLPYRHFPIRQHDENNPHRHQRRSVHSTLPPRFEMNHLVLPRVWGVVVPQWRSCNRLFYEMAQAVSYLNYIII